MAIDGASTIAGGNSTPSKPGRGKDQIPWSDDVWNLIDNAVVEEITRSRMGAKFLPQVHVHKKRTTVDSDVVVLPSTSSTSGQPADPSLSVDETTTTRVQEYSVQFRLSPAQMEAEGHYDTELNNQLAASPTPTGQAATASDVRKVHRASTAVSLALKTANILAQAEDLILLNGQNAVANSPLFVNGSVQPLDTKLLVNLDLGLLNIQPMVIVTSTDGATVGQIQPLASTPTAAFAATLPATSSLANVIQLPSSQVVAVRPKTPVTSPPSYQENSLNAVASGVSILQSNGYYDNYALVLHTFPYADLHQALAGTLIEPVEPIAHLVTAGIFGTGALPPFNPVISTGQPQAASTGLPTCIINQPTTANHNPTTALLIAPTKASKASPPVQGSGGGNVLYTGVLVSLAGNSMDVVRGLMDDALDVAVTFNQKDANEQYRFRSVQRFALRLKDPGAVVLLLYMDS